MKKMTRRDFMKTTAAGAAAVAAASVLAGCGSSSSTTASSSAASSTTAAASADAVSLKIALTDADTSNYAQGAYKISELVKEYTNGMVDIQVFAGGTLGDEAASTEGCANGEIDISTCANSVLENYFSECAALEKPFLWKNADAANYAMANKTGELMAAGVEKSGMHMIGWMESGFRNLFTTEGNEVTCLADLQGKKIRTMSSNLQVAMWTSFGTVATPLASSEQFTALQQGTIQGCENAISNDWVNGWYEVCPYVCWTNHYFCYIILTMSDAAYQKVAALGDDVMEGFKKGVSEGCTAQWGYLVEFNNDAVTNLEGAGIKFNTMPDDDIATMQTQYEDYISDAANNITLDETWVAAINDDIAAFGA